MSNTTLRMPSPSRQSPGTGVKVLDSARPAVSSHPCCQHCGQKATLFISQVSGTGKVTTQSFCILHALKTGAFHPKSWDLLDTGRSLQQSQPEKSCKCGLTESLLKHKGRAGCPQCYRVFAHLFRPLLPKLHMGSVHAGKRPPTSHPLPNVRHRVEVLKAALTQALQAHAYERAAQVRDELAALTDKA